MKKTLSGLGACIAATLVLGGCIDPGPGRAPAATPQNVSGGSRTASLFWEAPTSNTNGTPLTDLVGYRIYYGSNPQELVQTVQISSIGIQTYVIDDLAPGTWYFAIMAIARNGSESTLSNIVTKTIS